jgi:hypothetical protein
LATPAKRIFVQTFQKPFESFQISFFLNTSIQAKAVRK